MSLIINQKKLNGKHTSIYTGVFKRKKWEVHIYVKRKSVHVGCFDTEIEAAEAYKEAFERYRNKKL